MHVNLHKLKIKIKHLALEPAIIRKEAKKLSKAGRHPDAYLLNHHLRTVVRPEARATQLVYAFLRQKKYSEVEQPDSWLYMCFATEKSIYRMLKNYGGFAPAIQHMYRMSDQKETYKTVRNDVLDQYISGTDRERYIQEKFKLWLQGEA